MPVDAFTIASNNYLGMARVFAESYLAHHPGARVFLCLADRRDDRVRYDAYPFTVVLAEELGIPLFSHFAFRNDILELNTAVKPYFFKYLREHARLDRAFYFDPDILVCDRLTGLEQALEQHHAVLTPHITAPLDNRWRPPERVIRMCGIYNLGFLGLQLNGETEAFLDWWCDRLHRYCVVDLANGLFVDQSWMDFAPAYLDDVAIVRDPVFNVAYWNLPSRHPEERRGHWEIDGQRVGFFHFSGVDLENITQVSRHQDRIDLWSRPELRPLFELYRVLVQESGQSDVRACGYAFATFSGCGIAIPRIARRVLQEVDPLGVRWSDPFLADTEDSFLRWLSEPLPFAGDVVNRAALALWRKRPDVVREFPRLENGDLGRFMDWYLCEGAETAGLDKVFIEPLRAARSSMHRPPRDLELEAASDIDLRDPGGRADWLNDIVIDGPGPRLSRLAMLIHRTREDVRIRFPDPSGHDRLGLAYWMVTDGAREYQLHDVLVSPIRRSLPRKSQILLPLKAGAWKLRSGAQRRRPVVLQIPSPLEGAEDPGGALHEPVAEAVQPTIGVNLVGYFEGIEGRRSFAPLIERTLRTAGIRHVTVPLDHRRPEDMVHDRPEHESGFPFPVTILAFDAGDWDSVLRQMPVVARAGGRVIGYGGGSDDQLRVRFASAVDELWAPTQELVHRMTAHSSCPVYNVTPAIVHDPQSSIGRLGGLDPSLSWFLAVEQGPAAQHRSATSAAIECVRRVAREGGRCGLCLAVGKDRWDLAAQVAHLPVHVEVVTQADGGIDLLMSACTAYLDVRTEARFDPTLIEAAQKDKPIIAGWNELDHRASDQEGADERGAGQERSAAVIQLCIDAMLQAAAGSGPALERAFKLGRATADGMRRDGTGNQWELSIRRAADDGLSVLEPDGRHGTPSLSRHTCGAGGLRGQPAEND